MIGLGLALASVPEGVALREAGDLSGAEQALQAVVESEPSAVAWLELAVTRSWRGRISSARIAYEEALQLDPELEPAQVGQARMWMWSARPTKARQALGVVTSLEGEELRQALEELYVAEATVAMGFERGQLQMDVATSYRVSNPITLRAGAGWGSDPTLGNVGGYVSAGATWAKHGWWVTPGARWDALGGVVQLDVARKVGPCVPSAGVSVGSRTIWNAGLSCSTQAVSASVRGVWQPGSTRALIVSARTNGRVSGLVRYVELGSPAGRSITLGARWTVNPSIQLGLDGSVGTGALAGPGLVGHVRLRR